MPSHAPRFQWKRDPAGRVALVTTLVIAKRLGYTDQFICIQKKLPPKDSLQRDFALLLPWFPDHYNSYRQDRAVVIGFEGKMDPFGIGDLMDRFAYMFHNWGISDEHPMSTEQARPGKLRNVYVTYFDTIDERWQAGKEISVEEALEWGRPC